jgi:hypothetical protein
VPVIKSQWDAYRPNSPRIVSTLSTRGGASQKEGRQMRDSHGVGTPRDEDKVVRYASTVVRYRNDFGVGSLRRLKALQGPVKAKTEEEEGGLRRGRLRADVQ